MKQLVLPGTDTPVSRLAFGTAHLHRLFSAGDRLQLLETALACGITHYDTSPYYGFGLSESALGQLARRHPGQITITSKVGLYAPTLREPTSALVWLRKTAGKLLQGLNRPIVDWSVARAAASLELTLRRLRCETLDFLMLHEPMYGLLDADEFLAWLEQARKSGKIRFWGLAGELSGSLPWIREKHPLALVVQTRDSLAGREANALLENQRVMQFTYGYLSAARRVSSDVSAEEILSQALIRNATGAVIIASRRVKHLANLAKVAMRCG